MFIIKFKDSTQAIVYEIYAGSSDYSQIRYIIDDIDIWADVYRIDKIVRYFE